MNRDNPETLTFHTQLATVRPPSAAAAQTADGTKQLIDLPPTPWQHVRYWAAPFRRPGTGQCPPAAGHARRAADRPRPRLHGDVGPNCSPTWLDHKVHGQPVMPGTGFGEIALGSGQRSPRLAGAVGGRRRRSRADAAAGRLDPAHHAADPGREGQRRDSRRDSFALGHRRLDPPCGRESRSGTSQAPSAPTALVRSRHGGLARGPVLRAARHRSAPRTGVRRIDTHRPPAQRHIGNRGRPARRGDRAPRLPDPPGAARRGTAGPGRRAVERVASRLQRGHLPAGVLREDQGVRRGRASRPVPRRTGQPGRQGRPGIRHHGPRPDHRRHGHSDRRDQRYLPAASATPHRAIAVDAEDLRHRMGRGPGRCSAPLRRTAAGWC